MKIKTQIRLQKKAEVLRHIISNEIFDDFTYRGLNETVERIEKHRKAIEKLLKIEESINTVWFRGLDRRYPSPPDRRTGYETYGYESIESIECDLRYISDRSYAEFRLRWMLNIPEEVKKLLTSNKKNHILKKNE